MPKSLTPQIKSQMDAVQKRPVLIFEIGLPSPLKFAAYRTNISFPTGGAVYTAKAIKLSGLSWSLEGQINRITCKFDNTARDMAAYASTFDFRGRSLVVKRIYLDALDSALNYKEVFRGHLETPSGLDQKWMTVSATAGKPLYKKALNFAYQRQCPWDFGDDNCNTDGHADLSMLTQTGTADSGTTSTLTCSTLSSVDGEWNDGAIKITKAGIEYPRTVKSYDGTTKTVTIDVELPVTIDSSTTFQVWRGCDKTHDTCLNNKPGGPTNDNSHNFGGCIHITQDADQ
ncbi:MAG TPA: hypothetical protein DHV36_16130 [Desulfobacteraceae bacterium]|nr:hypothetical protein [Desulfobacteraceae bacterium]|tara:strand:+ start:1450 stop:2307 length:858 start_codon:yes stop_codon:yes gene_type:complete